MNMETSVDPIEYCREMVRTDDAARYQTTLFAPAKVQPALWALYAFNQEIAKTRENVSEPALGEIRLQWWRDVIEELRNNVVREHPVVQAASNHLTDATVLSLLDTLIDARQMDLYSDGPADQTALADYADQVGGGLSEAALRLSCTIGKDAENENAIRAARSTGAGWAMLGLVRAIPFHWASDRNFLPGKEGQAAIAITDAAKMVEAARPTIVKMLGFVELQVERASTCAKGMPKPARHVLLLNKQTQLYLNALKLVDNDPFKIEEPSDLKKLWSQLKCNVSGRI